MSSVPLVDGLSHLDPGEREAIGLAAANPGCLLLFDEAAGRRAASKLGIAITGTLGVLCSASQRDLIDLPAALDALLKTNFRAPMDRIRMLLAEDLARKSIG